jgi:PAS domain S-box-containing protein
MGERHDQAVPGDAALALAALGASPDLLTVHGARGEVLLASASVARLLGVREEELRGRELPSFLHPDDVARAGDALTAVLRGEPRQLEVRLRLPSGAWRWFEARVEPCREVDGISKVVCSCRDVHARKLREDALRKLARAGRPESAADAIVEVGPTGAVEGVDARVFELFGIDAAETARALALPDRESRAQRFHALAGERLAEPGSLAGPPTPAGDPDATSRDDLRLADGRILERHAFPRRDLHGRLRGRIVFHREVTEHRRAERELRERARQQQALAELGEMAMFAEEPEALLRAALRVAADALHADSAQFFALAPEGGTLVLRAVSAGSPSVAALPIADSHAGAALAANTPVVSTDLASETRFRDRALLEAGLLSGVSVVLNGRDRTAGVLCVHAAEPRLYGAEEVQFVHAVANILAAALVRLDIARELRDRNDQLRAIFDHALEALLTADDEGRILHANAAAERFFGARRGALVGRRWDELTGRDPGAFTATLRKLRLQGRPYRGEVELQLGASTRHAEVSAVPDVLPGVHLGAIRDLTEQRQMQARLALSDRMASVGTLAAGVAHELNNPLAYVAANLSWLAESLEEVAPAHRDAFGDALADARDGAERMRVIIRDLSTFSRSDEGATTAVDVAKVLDSCIAMCWNEVRHRARLVRDFADVGAVRGSDGRLGQVFLNLLVNAAHAIPEGAAAAHEIRVQVRPAGERVAVEFRDTGSGIPPAIRGRIFDPFFTTKPPGVGTGLGLSICHNIVAELGGAIEVESAPGQGSTFRVLLPVAEAGARDRGPRAARPARAQAARAAVLVVDDEPLVATAIRRALAAHDVEVVASAADALARVRDGRSYDLVLSDLLMPEMTGMDLHRELEALAPELAAKVVFITGGAFTPTAQAFLAERRVPCIDKPFDVDQLRALVARSAPAGAPVRR